MVIIAILIAMTSSSLQQALAAARGFRCMVHLRDLAFEFNTFGDPSTRTARGADAKLLPNQFRLATFQESRYKLDEFWGWGKDKRVARVAVDTPSLEMLRCPEVSGEYKFVGQRKAGDGAIASQPAVSYGFNARLNLGVRLDRRGRPRPKTVTLSPDVLDQGMTPLVWDVDGDVARQQRKYAEFSAPATKLDHGAKDYFFGNGASWFPSMRHNGVMHVAFIGGQVLSTKTPLRQSSWRWGFTPRQ